MFKIIPEPTFPCAIKIPRPGREADVLNVVFRHKSKDDLDEFFKAAAKKKWPDEQALCQLIESWDADMDLNVASMKALLTMNHQASKVIYEAYLGELHGARQGN